VHSVHAIWPSGSQPFETQDHLQIISLSRRPPPNVVLRKIAKIGLFVCLYP